MEQQQNNEADPWAWSLWKKHMEWKDGLAKSAAHKALGIPDDEMNIHADNRRGMDWKMAAVLAAAGLGGYALHQQGQAVTEPRPPVIADDSEYQVRFYDRNGNLIDVPHISKKPQQQ